MVEKLKSAQVSFSAKDWNRAPNSLELIDDLVFDWRLYPRKEIDHERVETYAKALQSGCTFPSVKIALFNGEKVIVDGVHRIESRKLLKIKYVDCSSLRFQSEAELFAEAVRLNSGHGKSFTKVELKANIKRLKRYRIDLNDIVAICHVPASEITMAITRPITTITSPSGRKISCTKVKPGEDIRAVLCLKNALVIVCKWAEANKIPTDRPIITELVTRARDALKKVKV